MYSGDTIAAIATALSPAGINIIRISGENAFSVTDSVFRSAKGREFSEIPSGTVSYGFIEFKGEVLDEVLMLKMAAPHTYTRENLTEIHCHGGILVTKRVLEAVLSSGARLAESGEFTKRAFLNGRIDLSQAEAVMDIIGSGSDLARRNSMKQLRGDLRETIGNIREAIILETAHIEAALDDPEHISLEGFTEELLPKVDALLKELHLLLSSFETGKIIKDGVNVVIAGRPNAGKSSLLNALLNEERAIVTSVAGTTRDTISESLDIGGLVLNLTDTAGIRQSEDVVESIGIDRARRAASQAQLILYIIDSPLGITEEDIENLKSFSDRKVILIYNKEDLVTNLPFPGSCSDSVNSGDGFIKDLPSLGISALNGSGIDSLKEMIRSMFLSGNLEAGHDIIITNVRHADLLKNAIGSLELVRSGIETGADEDLLSIDLMDAYRFLGEITGEEYRDDLADKIFSAFCMGK